MKALLVAITILLSGCVGLDQKNEGFAENAAEVIERIVIGIPTAGISELVLAENRKNARLQEAKEARYQHWYDNLSDQEKNIEDLKQAHRYQLMGTIMQGRQFPTYQLPPPQPYTPMHSINEGMIQPRQRTNCISNTVGGATYTNCY